MQDSSQPHGRTSAAGVPEPLRRYFERLDAAARGLSRTRRNDLRARVWQAVAVAAGPSPSDERLRAALDELGPPERLVDAPSPRGGTGRPLRDPLVVHLLGCSLLTAGVTGVLGLVRIWRSPVWPVRDAVVATLLVVAGAAALPAFVPVHPALAAWLGGLGVGAPVAALLGGGVLLLQRRAYRRTPPEVAEPPRIPPEGEGEPPPAGGVTPAAHDETPGSVGRTTSGSAPTDRTVDSKESS